MLISYRYVVTSLQIDSRLAVAVVVVINHGFSRFFGSIPARLYTDGQKHMGYILIHIGSHRVPCTLHILDWLSHLRIKFLQRMVQRVFYIAS